MSKAQPRRPKGIQAASSSQAAELVNQSGAANAFALFQAGLTPGVIDSTPTEAVQDGGDYSLVLRRLEKRDPTTKLKALQQLQEMLRDAQDDGPFVASLGEWCQAYLKLASARQKQIKERIHQVMLAIFSCSKPVKREMERHIKQVMVALCAGLCLIPPPPPQGGAPPLTPSPPSSASLKASEVGFGARYKFLLFDGQWPSVVQVCVAGRALGFPHLYSTGLLYPGIHGKVFEPQTQWHFAPAPLWVNRNL